MNPPLQPGTPQSCWHSLIAVCDDLAYSLHLASQNVKEPGLARVLREIATQHRQFLDELRRCFAQSGDAVSAPMLDVTGQGWGAFRSALAARDTNRILAECERRENAAVQAYRVAGQMIDDPASRAVVCQQLRHVEEAHEIVHELHDARAA